MTVYVEAEVPEDASDVYLRLSRARFLELFECGVGTCHVGVVVFVVVQLHYLLGYVRFQCVVRVR